MEVKARVYRPGGRWERFTGCQWYSHIRKGISFGSALAIVISYTQNSSILWAIVHGLLSWLYVIYRVMLKIGWF